VTLGLFVLDTFGDGEFRRNAPFFQRPTVVPRFHFARPDAPQKLYLTIENSKLISCSVNRRPLGLHHHRVLDEDQIRAGGNIVDVQRALENFGDDLFGRHQRRAVRFFALFLAVMFLKLGRGLVQPIDGEGDVLFSIDRHLPGEVTAPTAFLTIVNRRIDAVWDEQVGGPYDIAALAVAHDAVFGFLNLDFRKFDVEACLIEGRAAVGEKEVDLIGAVFHLIKEWIVVRTFVGFDGAYAVENVDKWEGQRLAATQKSKNHAMVFMNRIGGQFNLIGEAPLLGGLVGALAFAIEGPATIEAADAVLSYAPNG
jgi:hypothetical protein